jgi:hypothetical protein
MPTISIGHEISAPRVATEIILSEKKETAMGITVD